MNEIDTILSEMSEPLAFPIETPLKISVTKEGILQVECFQSVGGSNHALPMVLQFSPQAGGQLIQSLKILVDTGVITLTQDNEKRGIQ